MVEYSKDYTIDEMITVQMARQVTNDDVMIVGVATPCVWAAFTLAKVTHAPKAIFHYIMGNTFVLEPRQVSLLWLENTNVQRAYRKHNSGECTIELLPHDTLTTIEFFRPAQIDQYGNTNNICIGDWNKPKIRLPGCAGIGDFSMFYKKGQYLYVTRHDSRTFVPSEKLFFISGVGFQDGKPSICGGAGPQIVITDLAVLGFDEKTKRMMIKSVHPGITVEQVQQNTGFELIIPDNVPETEIPTVREIQLLREKVDPLGIRKLETLTGKERAKLLTDIVMKEMQMEKRVMPIISP
ncbi:MAG: CoA-transferase subunit beta [Candidatus Helarchaeota archaeon]